MSTAVERHYANRPDDKTRRSVVERSVLRIVERSDETCLALEVQEALRWAEEIQVQGMPRPVATDSASVALNLAPVARRFRGSGQLHDVLDEAELATSAESFLVLGEPGSGKTTTLKRLTLTLFEESSLSTGNSELSMPVVVVCRQVDWTLTDLAVEVIRRVGVDPSIVRTELGLSDDRALQFAAELLDHISGFLLIDGLDEIAEPSERSKLFLSLERLRRLVNRARIVCSCRSGDAPHLDGFSAAELLPLNDEQITSIVEARSPDGDAFLNQVAAAGISADLLDRPLFLNQLVTVFETTGSLPERPVDLTRQLVRLLLHDWDEQRRVARRSSYSDFDNENKKDFLAEFAYRLTTLGRASFDEAELLKIYDEIYAQFNLPRRQARQVVREIESHIGIIVEVGDGFQFSHYTMQEYLCADNISRRRPTNDDMVGYMQRFPAVMAVTVAVSTQPNRWLLDCVGEPRRFKDPQVLASFISRLGQERPRFSEDTNLGNALLRVMAQVDALSLGGWERLSQIAMVRASVASACGAFDLARHGDRVALMRRGAGQVRRTEFARVLAEPLEMFVSPGTIGEA